MKRNIIKNIFKTCAAVFLAASLAGCSNLIVNDDGSNDSNNLKITEVPSGSESSEKSAGKGSAVVTIGVPDYSKIAAENVARSARAVAPQSAYARLGYSTDGENFVYLDAVALSSDNATTDSNGLFTEYTLTFSGIPEGTYAEGWLKIQLLGSADSSEAVSQGTNSETVTVSSSAAADAKFYTVPTSLSANSGSLSKGEMVFLSKRVAANSVSTLTVTVGDSDSYPLVALFNPDGSFKSAAQFSSSENTLEIDRYDETESAVYYIGLYSKDADISSYTATWTDEAYFTEFDPDELYALNGNSNRITTDVSAADGSWSVTGGTEKDYAGVWTNDSGELKTYDYDAEKGTGFDYTNGRMFAFNSATSVALKLKIGAGKTKILRIDGGMSKTLSKYSSSGAVTFNIKDSDESAKTWSPYVGNSTYYVEVTGDSDGYVAISSSNDGRIYGITLADEVVDLSAAGAREGTYSYYGLSVMFSSGESSYSIYIEKDSNGSADGVILAPTVYAYHYTRINKASYDGTNITLGDSESTEITDISYTWTKGGSVIEGATSSTYTATSSGTYKVTVAYTDSTGKTHTDSAICKVYNSGADTVTITFDKNYESATITTTTQSVENGVASLTTADELGLVNNEKVFKGWAASAAATEVEYADGAEVTFTEDTTLYAVWNDNFTKFTAAKLREEYLEKNSNLSVGETDEVKLENSEFSYDNDNIIVSKGVQIKYTEGATVDYNEAAGTGYSYDYRFSFNSKTDSTRGIKLRIGAGQTKILRIDGGQATNLKDWTSEIPAVTMTITDATGTKTWSPYVRYSTYYVEVTGCDDGYISITSDDHYYSGNKQVSGEIYGIYVVESKANLSSYIRGYISETYNSPVVTLDSTADLAGNESVALKASAATPTKTTTTKTAAADGTEKPTVVSNDEELSNVVLSYQWYKSGEKIEGATEATYNATSSATYSVKVSYSYTDENGDTKSKSTTKECVVSDSKASKVVVEFDKNSSTASISTDELEIERGAEVPLTKADELGLVNSGYAFMGWAESADGKVSYTDGADISFYHNTTLYAVWVAKSSGELVGYPDAGGEWTQAESKLPADVTDSADNTILTFAKVAAPESETCKGVDIDGNSVVYTTRMSTSGSTSSSRYIKITVPEGKTADVFCAFRSGDSSTRSCGIGKKSGQYYDVVEKVSSSSKSTLSYLSNAVALPAGTYYLNSDSTVYIFALQVRLYSEE